MFVKKKGDCGPNLGDFALTGRPMPIGRNRKGGNPTRKRKSKVPTSLLPHTSIAVVGSSSSHSAADGISSSSSRSQAEGSSSCFAPADNTNSMSFYSFSHSTPKGNTTSNVPMNSSFINCQSPPYLPEASQYDCLPWSGLFNPYYMQYPMPTFFNQPSPAGFPSISTPSMQQIQSSESSNSNPFQLKMLNHMMKVPSWIHKKA